MRGKLNLFFAAVVGAVVVGSGGAWAGGTQPAYCDAKAFAKTEFKARGVGSMISRLHTYRLGKAVLAGMAVGNSQMADVKALAESLGTAKASDGYCSWYFNDGNKDAEKTFNWQYLNNPTGLTEQQAIEEYTRIIGPDFGQAANNFITCAETHKYVGMGCNGMKHRGPTVFAMVLAYSGCDPASATAIANGVWGLNGVPSNTRLAVTRAAFELGQKNPSMSARLRAVFEGQ